MVAPIKSGHTNRKSRIGLLLKGYYNQPCDESSIAEEYSLEKLEKLRTDQLMSKAVESLRSFKEAESELRMLLYNNCDKLLEAVQVVVDIRSKCGELVDISDRSNQGGDRLILVSNRRTSPETVQLQSVLNSQQQVEKLMKVIEIPNKLREMHAISGLEIFLKYRMEIFTPKMLKYKLISNAYNECLKIVHEKIVPKIEENIPTQTMLSRGKMLKMLLELYTNSEYEDKRNRVLCMYLESELVSKYEPSICSSPIECLKIFRHYVDLLFLANEITSGDRGAGFSRRIEEELLPSASEDMVHAVKQGVKVILIEESPIVVSPRSPMEGSPETSRIGSPCQNDWMVDFLTESVSAHMRIPNIDLDRVEEFRKELIVAYITSKFRGVAGDTPTDPTVVHTRCVAIVFEIHQWLLLVGEESTYFDSVIAAVGEYYEQVLMPKPIDDIQDYFGTLVRQMEMVYGVVKRDLALRTYNAIFEIFNQESPEVADESFSCVSQIVLFRIVKLFGTWVGIDINRLKKVVTEFVRVLPEAVDTNSTQTQTRRLVFDYDSQIAQGRLDVSSAVAICTVANQYVKSVREICRQDGSIWNEDDRNEFMSVVTGYPIESMMQDIHT
jgi:hypothetical protein